MSKLKKGMRVIKQPVVVDRQAMTVAVDMWTKGEGIQDLKNLAIAKAWQESECNKRMLIAQELLWKIEYIWKCIPNKGDSIIFTGVADKLWKEFALEYKECAFHWFEQTGKAQLYPTHKWVRHMFAFHVKALIAKRDRAVTTGFISRGWGPAVPYAYPELNLEPGEEVVFIERPEIIVLEDDDLKETGLFMEAQDA